MSNSLILDNLDEKLLKRLQVEASRRNSDVSTVVRETLQRSFPEPIQFDERGPVYRNISDLAGTWTDEDVREFEANTAQFHQIDEELWK